MLGRMSEFADIIRNRMEEQGFPVDEHQLVQFDLYLQELKDWNTRINLTSLTDDLDIINKHFIDSLLLVRYEPLEPGVRIADVGTGAGFPGLPIKIYRCDLQLSLLESVGKKAKFLKHIVAELELEDVNVINDRAEVVARSPEHREQYDLVVARCVAHLSVLAEYCLPLVSVGGKFVAHKGSEVETEIRDAGNALEILGGRFNRLERDAVYGDMRSLIFIEKVKGTPDKYPRRPGMPRKRPL